MTRRLRTMLLAREACGVGISTFHRLCGSLLREHGAAIGIYPPTLGAPTKASGWPSCTAACSTPTSIPASKAASAVATPERHQEPHAGPG